MKFSVGDIVQHKISKEKAVIIEVYPKGFFREQVKYRASYGEDFKFIKRTRTNDYIQFLESEIELAELKKEKKV
jgi:hypothetical protein